MAVEKATRAELRSLGVSVQESGSAALAVSLARQIDTARGAVAAAAAAAQLRQLLLDLRADAAEQRQRWAGIARRLCHLAQQLLRRNSPRDRVADPLAIGAIHVGVALVLVEAVAAVPLWPATAVTGLGAQAGLFTVAIALAYSAAPK